jgi:hypothetical protein
MLPEHCRNAGIAKAEKALRELTDAADQLGIAAKATDLLVSLWNAFHPGGLPPLVRYAAPILDKPAGGCRRDTSLDRPNLDRIASPRGQALLQEVLRGEISQRQASLKLDVHHSVFCNAVRRLRKERQQQRAAPSANDSAETTLTFSLKSH